jgi:hypothetical protein
MDHTIRAATSIKVPYSTIPSDLGHPGGPIISILAAPYGFVMVSGEFRESPVPISPIGERFSKGGPG